MSYQPHLHKGGELYHARTFGSKNGISNTPGYRAKGRKAVGRFVGVDAQGHPIYDYGSAYNKAVQRYQQRQRINAAVATNAGAKGQSARELRERQANANMAKARRQEAQQYRINKAVATNAGAKGQSARELRERHANADMTNARRQDIANYNSFASRLKRTGENIGNWLNERGDRASNFISNIAKRARTAIGDARTAIGNAWDGKAGAGTGKTQMEEYGRSGRGREAQEAKERYDRSIVGRFNAAREWMGRRAEDVANAAGRARTAIGNAWDGSAGRGSAKDKANAASSNAKAYNMYARRNAKAGNAEMGSKYAKLSRENDAEARRQQQAYDRSIVGTAERLMNRAGSAIRGGAAAVSSGARRASEAASNVYTRSGASNATKTLTTKGPIQVGKNVASNVGGREAQQAKGDKARVKAVKEHRQRAERNWEAAQNEYARLNDAVNNATNERERNNAYAELDKFVRETYRPAQTDYNNTHKNRK